MINPMVADLRGPRTTLLIGTISLAGIDLTGAAYRLQVRNLADAAGALLANLTTVSTASAEGVRLISVTGSGPAAVSVLGFRFNKTTMAAMPAPVEPGQDAEFLWDLLITPSGGVEERYIKGRFIVEAGVTQ